jgi:hypothetical protein
MEEYNMIEEMCADFVWWLYFWIVIVVLCVLSLFN